MSTKHKKSYRLSPEEIEYRLVIENTYLEPVIRKESIKKVKISEKREVKKPNILFQKFIEFLRRLLRVEEIVFKSKI